MNRLAVTLLAILALPVTGWAAEGGLRVSLTGEGAPARVEAFSSKLLELPFTAMVGRTHDNSSVCIELKSAPDREAITRVADWAGFEITRVERLASCWQGRSTAAPWQERADVRTTADGAERSVLRGALPEGRAAVVAFSAPWCDTCEADTRQLVDWAAQSGGAVRIVPFGGTRSMADVRRTPTGRKLLGDAQDLRWFRVHDASGRLAWEGGDLEQALRLADAMR